MLLTDVDIASRTVSALAKKKIYTVDDLLRFIPRRYLDYRNVIPLMEAVGKDCPLEGYAQAIGKKQNNGRTMITIDLIENTTGELVHIHFFGQSFIWKRIESLKQQEIVVCGKVTKDTRFGYGVTNPNYVCLKEEFYGKIVPVYPNIKGVSEKTMRKHIQALIGTVTDPLEDVIVQKAHLMPYKQALEALHFPKSFEQIKQAKKRLAFNDLLYLSMSLKQSETAYQENSLFQIQTIEKTMSLVQKLPFNLTPDQAQALNKIRSCMQSGKRLDCLVQGDVGSGKTIVAILSMLMVVENGFQAAVMAPTTILAEQHYNDIQTLLRDSGYRVVMLSSNMTAKEKKDAMKAIRTGEAQFIIGTHSLFADGVEFYNLGITVIDEEHRFGVAQRTALQKKAANGVHVISMSATPIPRSVASVIYGENKQIIEIKTMPEGRKPIQTAICNSEKKIFEFMEKQLCAGHQAYVICPLVTDAAEDSLMGNVDAVESVYESYRMYFETIGFRTGMVFGKQKKEEREEIIEKFQRNEIQILVATTVVEVGVNVPNASLIVMHNAERFGLATMHQLRGRVGRSNIQSYCILKSAYRDNERLITMTQTTDGFAIAQKDLELRGMGDIIGTRQTGNDQLVDLMMDLPNLYACVKKYAAWALQAGLAKKLLELYEENKTAKAA